MNEHDWGSGIGEDGAGKGEGRRGVQTGGYLETGNSGVKWCGDVPRGGDGQIGDDFRIQPRDVQGAIVRCAKGAIEEVEGGAGPRFGGVGGGGLQFGK